LDWPERSCSQHVVVADVLAVEPGADLASNLLPDLIVDNLIDDDKFATTFDMLWDESIISWQAIGVTSQHTDHRLDRSVP
jgi:hypothetical protein